MVNQKALFVAWRGRVISGPFFFYTQNGHSMTVTSWFVPIHHLNGGVFDIFGLSLLFTVFIMLYLAREMRKSGKDMRQKDGGKISGHVWLARIVFFFLSCYL